jgi:glycosyltransferase involved in cell wall biosynthesis
MKYDISVVVPVYNGEKYIKRCLESLLDQSIKPREIVVVDDGSEDNSVKIASTFPVKIIRHRRNEGLATARNTGLKEVKTELVAFIDVDCTADPDMLKNMLKNYTAPEIGGVGGRGIEMNNWGLANEYRSVYSMQSRGDKKSEVSGLFGLCFSFRREAIEKVGMFDPFFKTNGEDGDISIRLRKSRYKLIYDPSIIVYHHKEDTVKSYLKMDYNAYFYGAFSYLKNEGGGPRWLGMRLATNSTNFIRRIGRDLYRRRVGFILMDIADYLVKTKAAIDVYRYYKRSKR